VGLTSVFVSHSSRDQAAASQVRDQLLTAGFSALFVAFDPEQAVPVGRH
jgi:hypothetical protein